MLLLRPRLQVVLALLSFDFQINCPNKTATDRGEDGEARREVNEERRITEFMTAIALCHTVQVEASNLNIKIIFDCR